MVTAISPFGMFHTAVSVSAIGFGLWALVRDGKIDPRTIVGKLYGGAMLIGSLTAFGIFRHGGFTPGHALSAITLALLLSGVFAARSKWLGIAAYVEVVSFSASFFLLWVFTATETLTRLPVGNPIAAGPSAPVVLVAQLSLLAIFVLGASYQMWGMSSSSRRGIPT